MLAIDFDFIVVEDVMDWREESYQTRDGKDFP